MDEPQETVPQPLPAPRVDHREAPPSPRPTEDRAIKLAIGGSAGLLLITLILSIHVSTLGVSFGTLLFGSEVVWRGHHAAFRAAAIDAQRMTLLPVIDVTLTLTDSRGIRQQTKQTAVGMAEIRLAIPADLDAHATLAARIKTAVGVESLRVALRARNVPAPLSGHLTPPDVLRRDRGTSPNIPAISFYPRGGHLVAGLQNTIDARLETAPQGGISVSSSHPPFTAMTDDAGFFSFVGVPMPESMDLTLSVGTSPPANVRTTLRVDPAQLLLLSTPRAFARPGQKVALRLQTLPFADPVYLDTWVGNALIAAQSVRPQRGSAFLEVLLPDQDRSFVRFDAFRDPLAPADTLSTQLLWLDDSGEPEKQQHAMDALALLPGGQALVHAAQLLPETTRGHAIALTMSRIDPDVAGTPLLRATLQQQRQRLDARRTQLRSHLNTFFAFTLGLGIALALGWAIRHHLRVRHAVQGVLREGIDAHETSIDPTALHKLVRFRDLYDALLALCAAALAGYAIWVLLIKMRWE